MASTLPEGHKVSRMQYLFTSFLVVSCDMSSDQGRQPHSNDFVNWISTCRHVHGIIVTIRLKSFVPISVNDLSLHSRSLLHEIATVFTKV